MPPRFFSTSLIIQHDEIRLRFSGERNGRTLSGPHVFVHGVQFSVPRLSPVKDPLLHVRSNLPWFFEINRRTIRYSYQVPEGLLSCEIEPPALQKMPLGRGRRPERSEILHCLTERSAGSDATECSWSAKEFEEFQRPERSEEVVPGLRSRRPRQAFSAQP